MAVDADLVTYRAQDHINTGRWLFLGGTAASLVGFLLPWFKWGASAQWYYGGWQLMTQEGLSGLFLILIAYAALLFVGGEFLTRSPTVAAGLAMLALLVVLTTLVVVSLAAGDALENIRSLDSLEWSFGLPIMLTGHALMIWGAFATWALMTMRWVVLGDPQE